MSNIWRLSYENVNPASIGGATGGSILFSAETIPDAINSALRWMHSREKMEDLFGRFLYFEISPYVIGPIDDDGSLTTRGGFRLMEWSRDRAGVDKETYCEWKIAEYNRADKK